MCIVVSAVIFVPSVGILTALYADSTPHLNAFAISAEQASLRPESPLEKPLKKRERITPEFPLPPRRRAMESFAATSPRSPPRTGISFLAAAIVIPIFVPVSPSGTGKILRLFIFSF